MNKRQLTKREFHKIVGDNIKRERNKRCWTQLQFGEMLGVSSVSVHFYENGYGIPLFAAAKCAELFEISLENLLAYKSNVNDE